MTMSITVRDWRWSITMSITVRDWSWFNFKFGNMITYDHSCGVQEIERPDLEIRAWAHIWSTLFAGQIFVFEVGMIFTSKIKKAGPFAW